MKNILSRIGAMSTIITLIITGASCTKDYVEPEFKTKSFSVYASFMNHSNGGANIDPTYMTINSLEGMMDISQGFLSHEWSFWKDENFSEDNPNWKQMEKGDGIQFMKKNCGLSYGSKTDYSPYTDYSLAPTNNQDNLVFLFEKWGRYKAKIRNIYDSQIEYMIHQKDTVYKGDVNVYYKAEPLGNGQYLVEREYIFEVYDTLSVEAKVYEDLACTQEIDVESLLKKDSTLTVTSGKTLYFRDATGTTKYDSGTSRQWGWSYAAQTGETVSLPVPKVSPETSTDSIATFVFNEKGRYKVNLTVKRDEDPLAVKKPSASKTKMIPLYIKVQ